MAKFAKLMEPYKVKLGYENRENQYDADTCKLKSITKKVKVKIPVEFSIPQNLFNYN